MNEETVTEITFAVLILGFVIWFHCYLNACEDTIDTVYPINLGIRG